MIITNISARLLHTLKLLVLHVGEPRKLPISISGDRVSTRLSPFTFRCWYLCYGNGYALRLNDVEPRLDLDIHQNGNTASKFRE